MVSQFFEEGKIFQIYAKFLLIRSLQILETVNLMALGLPHRIKLKTFISRYKMFQNPEFGQNCSAILSLFGDTLKISPDSRGWAVGPKHVFLSEYAKQMLEKVLRFRRLHAARVIQNAWRCHKDQEGFTLAPEATFHQATTALVKISTPKKDLNLVELASMFLGLDLVFLIITLKKILLYKFNLKMTFIQDNPPPVPPSRSYTIMGNDKIMFPQTRFMKQDFIGRLIFYFITQTPPSK